MANEDDFELVEHEEEDVVIEGSDLYNILKKMGRIDFESTTVNRKEIPDNSEDIGHFKDEGHVTKYQCSSNIWQTIRNFVYPSKEIKGRKYNATKKLEVILKLEPLLDDHSWFIQRILEESSVETKSCLVKTFATSLFLMPAFFLPKNIKLPCFFLISVLSTYFLYEKYHKFGSLNRLKTLVYTQNSLLHLQKRALKILRNTYNIKLDSNKSQRKFNALEVQRLKFLQPICETLVKSIEHCSKVYYENSSILNKMICSSEEIILSSSEQKYNFNTTIPNSSKINDADDFVNINNFITQFDENSFKLHGEVTHKNINQLFYILILVQSDMMLLLALIYSRTSKNHKINLKLSNIIHNVQHVLIIHVEKLKMIMNQYEISRTAVLPQKQYKSNISKYQELYIHVDLLSHKLQSAYSSVSAILEEIDKFSEQERNSQEKQKNDDLINSLISNMHKVQKEINVARNFAEFNILLINQFRNNSQDSQTSQENFTNVLNFNDKSPEDQGNLPIVFDTDPQVFDECFEEYIKEEYLRPLCKDDDDIAERAKMDRLLEKNFMSELKEVLMDKYKRMSEREARALLRYRKSNCDKNPEENKTENEVSSIPMPPIPPPLPSARLRSLIDQRIDGNHLKDPPPPPPLPPLLLINPQNEEADDDDVDVNEENKKLKMKLKMPVPLPRAVNQLNLDNKEASDTRQENIEPAERFELRMAIEAKIPGITFAEETFIGSGENSEAELAASDCEEDEIPS